MVCWSRRLVTPHFQHECVQILPVGLLKFERLFQRLGKQFAHAFFRMAVEHRIVDKVRDFAFGHGAERVVHAFGEVGGNAAGIGRCESAGRNG